MHVLGGDQDRSHAEVNRQQAENAVLAQRRLKILRVAGAGACASSGSMSAGNPASTSPAASPRNRRYKSLCYLDLPRGWYATPTRHLEGCQKSVAIPDPQDRPRGALSTFRRKIRRYSDCLWSVMEGSSPNRD